jgi:hypothetical protein
MSFRGLVALSASVLAGSIAAGYAGPCTEELDRMQAQVDAKTAAVAAAGPAARENHTAMMHREQTSITAAIEQAIGAIQDSHAADMQREPKPASIAAAEETLDEGTRIEQAVAAIKRAREADEVGDSSACDQTLEDVQHAIDSITASWK